ncbi:MAG: dienelactone hydrolase family protein [Solirubrobacteraceae bacterium]
MDISENTIEYRDRDTKLIGVLMVNDTGAECPGVLVVHGGAGLDDHSRTQARRLARAGFLTLACDMYGEGVAGDRDRVMSCINELLADRNRMAERAWAGIELLASHPSCAGHIAAVGYCFGGRAVLELARSGADLAGVISVHGGLDTGSPAAPGDIKAKVLVCHGALDPHVPLGQVTAMIEEMNAAEADWQLIVYGGAAHGFTDQGDPGTPGVAYDPAADARSFLAITAFLREVLGSAG